MRNALGNGASGIVLPPATTAKPLCRGGHWTIRNRFHCGSATAAAIQHRARARLSVAGVNTREFGKQLVYVNADHCMKKGPSGAVRKLPGVMPQLCCATSFVGAGNGGSVLGVPKTHEPQGSRKRRWRATVLAQAVHHRSRACNLVSEADNETAVVCMKEKAAKLAAGRWRHLRPATELGRHTIRATSEVGFFSSVATVAVAAWAVRLAATSSGTTGSNKEPPAAPLVLRPEAPGRSSVSATMNVDKKEESAVRRSTMLSMPDAVEHAAESAALWLDKPHKDDVQAAPDGVEHAATTVAAWFGGECENASSYHGSASLSSAVQSDTVDTTWRMRRTSLRLSCGQGSRQHVDSINARSSLASCARALSLGCCARKCRTSVLGDGRVPGWSIRVILYLGTGTSAAQQFACTSRRMLSVLLFDTVQVAAEYRPTVLALAEARTWGDEEEKTLESVQQPAEVLSAILPLAVCEDIKASQAQAELDNVRVRRAGCLLATLASRASLLSRELTVESEETIDLDPE